MDIVILSLSRWDGKFSSTILSLSKEFARHHRVFYVANPFTIKEAFARFFSMQIRRRILPLFFGINTFQQPVKGLPNFIGVTPMVTLSINWLPRGKLFSFLAYLNDRIVYLAVRKALRKYRVKKFIYINSFNPLYGNNFPRSFHPDLTVYHCVDDIQKSLYVLKHGPLLERKLIHRSNVVVTTSSELARLKGKYTDKVFVISNAADVGLFQKAANQQYGIPPEIQQIEIGKKLIVYIGNICHRIDYNLLLAIADHLPDQILLMVGPITTNNHKKSGLIRRPNVVFTGQKKLEELPAYLQYSHCCIIPFLCNTLTKSIYPLKINEYLSAGKPVVTTPFSEDIKTFNGIVHVANGYDEFVRKIKEAILTDNIDLRRKRVAYSAANNWGDRADRFLKLVDGFAKRD